MDLLCINLSTTHFQDEVIENVVLYSGWSWSLQSHSAYIRGTHLVFLLEAIISLFYLFWVILHCVHMLFLLPSQGHSFSAHQIAASFVSCRYLFSACAHTSAVATQFHVWNWLFPRMSLLLQCSLMSEISISVDSSFNKKISWRICIAYLEVPRWQKQGHTRYLLLLYSFQI